MKIAIDARPLFDANAQRGIGKYVYSLLRAIFALRNNIEFFLIHDERMFDGKVIDIPKNASWVPMSLRSRILGKQENWVHEYFILSKFLKKNKVNIYHATALSGPISSSVLRVSTCFDFIPLRFNEDNCMSIKQLRNDLNYKVKLFTLKISDHVIAISDVVKMEAQERLRLAPEKITSIKLGVDFSYSKLSKTEFIESVHRELGITKPFGLYVGGFDRRKNLGALVSSVSKMIMEGFDFQLLLVGEKTPPAIEIEKKLLGTELFKRIIFTGYQTEAKLLALYHSAKCFCFPSLEEGFGLPVIEAQSSGLPVIAFRSKAIEEISNGTVIMVDDMGDEFQKKLSVLLADEDQRVKLSRLGCENAKRFKWEDTAMNTLHVYEQLMAIQK
ncbi:MAG: glycosyltransferase family 4 protein [Fibrobacteres bacterium]|nr:glycosyltransferase family 4 protein [Fibrobacterota bacterium]